MRGVIMENEKRRFYLIIGIILLFLGLFSFMYGSIIPTKYLPMNDLPSLIFKLSGVIFLIIGIIILVFMRKKSINHERKTTSKDVSPENQNKES
jgi:membrane protein implicated in regulation of membrane protease activity